MNKTWVFGGEHGGSSHGHFNDVWYSTNGTTWTCATAAAAWSPRSDHTPVVFNNHMWVIDFDVWYSSNGKTWAQAPKPPWGNNDYRFRKGVRAVVCNGKIWVMGGQDYYMMGRSDACCSSDGNTWALVTSNAGWLGRVGFAALVFDQKIWVLGGYAPGWKGTQGTFLNDVWYTSMPAGVRSWQLFKQSLRRLAAQEFLTVALK